MCQEGLMVFSDDFLAHFLKIKKKICWIHQNYLVALSHSHTIPTTSRRPLTTTFFGVVAGGCQRSVTVCLYSVTVALSGMAYQMVQVKYIINLGSFWLWDQV